VAPQSLAALARACCTAEENMLTLYRFYPSWGLSCFSQFVVKVDTYLRMTNVPYRSVSLGLAFQQTAPRGKLPYIDHNGQIVADSQYIVEHLKGQLGDPLDAHLTPVQRASARAIRCLVEDHLRWITAHDRWMSPHEPYFHTSGFQELPRAAYEATRDHYVRQMREHVGTLTPAEVEAEGRADIDALSELLGDQPYFLGDRPTSLDATTYAFLGHLVFAQYESNLNSYAASRPNLRAYCQRMRAQYFPEEIAAPVELVAK
jgi:glutathione S-transferase